MANAIPITAPAPDAAAAAPAPAPKAAPKVDSKGSLESMRVAALEAGAQRATLEDGGKCLRVDN